MLKRMAKVACIFAATLLVTACPSRADIIVDNTGSTVTGHGTLYGPNDPPTQYYAQEFSTGNQSYTLTSIVVNIGGATTSPVTPFGELIGDNGGTPQGGTDLANFTTTATVGSAYANDSFTTTTSITLAANTSYWFVLGSSDNDFKWSYTSSDTINSNGSSITNYAKSANLSSWTVETNGPFLIQVNGSPAAVPEPSSLALGGIAALVGMATWARRRRANVSA